MQTCVGPVLATSLSVSSYEFRSVDLKDLGLLVSSNHFDCYTLLCLFPQSSLSLGRDLVRHPLEYYVLRSMCLICPAVGLQVCSPLLQKEALIIMLNKTLNKNISIVEYQQKTFITTFQTNSIQFDLGLWTTYFLVLGHSSSAGFKNKQTEIKKSQKQKNT